MISYFLSGLQRYVYIKDNFFRQRYLWICDKSIMEGKSYSLLIYSCDLQDIASAFLATYIKTRCSAATFTRSSLIAGNRDGARRPIFDGRFRVIVARGTAYDNTMAVTPTEPQCATECIIVVRWKAKYRTFRRGTMHLNESRRHNLLAVCAIY